MTYHSPFIEGETEAQEGSATSLPKVTLQVRGLVRPCVCLIPHPGLPHMGAVGSYRAIRMLAEEVTDPESGPYLSAQ